LWRASLANRGTGAVGDLSVFDLITIENGLVAKYVGFLDSDGLRRLMRGERQPMFGRRANREPAGMRADRPASAPGSVAERDRTEAMLRAWWDRRVSAGSIAIDEYFTADGELHLVGDPSTVPFARHHSGATEVKALIDQIDMEFEWVRSVTGEVLVSGDRAAMRWMADVRHRGTGAQGRIHAFDHFTLRDGRIRVQTEFFDTASTAAWIEG
jgi:ketosteroid isomerase-like protein